MKMKQIAVLGALAVASVLVGACSSSSSNNGGNAGSCLASSANSGSAACNTCVENACSSQVNNLNSPCSGYISCACPGGTFSQTAASSMSCQAQLQTQSCAPAVQSFVSCIASATGTGGSCASACAVTFDASTGGFDAGSTDQ